MDVFRKVFVCGSVVEFNDVQDRMGRQSCNFFAKMGILQVRVKEEGIIRPRNPSKEKIRGD